MHTIYLWCVQSGKKGFKSLRCSGCAYTFSDITWDHLQTQGPDLVWWRERTCVQVTVRGMWRDLRETRRRRTRLKEHCRGATTATHMTRLTTELWRILLGQQDHSKDAPFEDHIFHWESAWNSTSIGKAQFTWPTCHFWKLNRHFW